MRPTLRARYVLRSSLSARSRPPTTIDPPSGRSSAAIRCSRVDLPQPDGPSRNIFTPADSQAGAAQRRDAAILERALDTGHHDQGSGSLMAQRLHRVSRTARYEG